MGIITTLLYILFVFCAIILITTILLQEGKGGGFGDALGAAGKQAFGVKAKGIQVFTGWVAVIFLASAVFIHVMTRQQSGSTIADTTGGEVIEAPSDPGAGAGGGGAAPAGGGGATKPK